VPPTRGHPLRLKGSGETEPPKNRRDKLMRQLLILVWVGVTFICGIYGQNAEQDATGGFGAKYASLKPEQKALVDDWIKRFSVIVQKRVASEEAYDKLPQSMKTTFSAVTHALLSMQLTDESGQELGPAIQIVDKLDTVRGEVPGARGDGQFRIYVQLKPDKLGVLDRSKEFRRTEDNTVYHRGFPICYRSRPDVPSIQVSATQDKTRADIDVDYRSSGFPKALVNGHLAASNSDVRAGRNDEKHNSQWSGLNNWWRGLLSLPQVAERFNGRFEGAGRAPAEPPERAGMKPAEAVFDMLNTWLVKRDTGNALSYFGEQSYACEDLEGRESPDRGMAKFRLLTALQRANDRFGKVQALGDVSTAVTPEGTGARSKVVRHPHEGQFALYDVREDAAERFKCENRLDPAQASPKAVESNSFGKYYGAVFRLGKGSAQTTLATLWMREAKSWKLISYDLDPVWDEYRAPDTSAAAPAVAPTVYVTAPAELVSRVTQFLTTWVVKRNVDEAFGHISAQCTDCVKLNPTAGKAVPKTLEDARAQLKQAMHDVIENTGTVKRLEEATVAPQPNHADVKLVKHGSSKAFALASIPDYMARALECKARTMGEAPRFKDPAGDKSWGKYYAMGLRLAKTGEDSGVLWAVWAQEGAVWKIIAYTVLTP
jgi:hypothetical protein